MTSTLHELLWSGFLLGLAKTLPQDPAFSAWINSFKSDNSKTIIQILVLCFIKSILKTDYHLLAKLNWLSLGSKSGISPPVDIYFNSRLTVISCKIQWEFRRRQLWTQIIEDLLTLVFLSSKSSFSRVWFHACHRQFPLTFSILDSNVFKNNLSRSQVLRWVL